MDPIILTWMANCIMRARMLAIREQSADTVHSTPAKPLPGMLTSGGSFLSGVGT